MIIAIEKELMIVGCMAFIFKIITNTSTFLQEERGLKWFHALENADLLIPITSFVYCFQGIGLIIFCSIQTDFWSKGYYMEIYSLLDPFYDLIQSAWYAKSQWVPFVSIRSQMEFRIFHDIFCETYQINRKAFAFNEYVRISWENYLIKLVTIPVTAWVMVLALLGLDFARREIYPFDSDCGKAVKAIHRRLAGGDDDGGDDCDDDHRRLAGTDDGTACGCDDDDHRRLAGSGDDSVPCDYNYDYWPCLREEASWGFLWLGCVLVGVCIIVMMFARYYEVQLLKSRGINCVEDYPVFLELIEEQGMVNPNKEAVSEEEVVSDRNKKLTEAELKEIIEGIRRKKVIPGHGHGDGHGDGHGHGILANLAHYLSIHHIVHTTVGTGGSIGGWMLKYIRIGIAECWYFLKYLTHSICVCSFSRSDFLDPGDFIEAIEDEFHQADASVPEMRAPVASMSSKELYKKANTVEPTAKKFTEEEFELDRKAAREVEEKLKKDRKEKMSAEFADVSHGAMNVVMGAKMKLKKYKSIASIEDRLTRLKKAFTSHGNDDMKKIFLCANPSAYFGVVEHLLMLISLYIGLWLTYVVSHADYIAPDGVGRFVTIAPGIIASSLFGLIVRSTVMLKCLTRLDTDVLEEVLEQSESSRDLGSQVKQKMLRRLSALGEPEKHLRLLFDEIDVDGSEVLSREEFHQFCAYMNVTFSKRKWRIIFREIDRDANDEISYEELFLFLFPEHEAARNQERRRAAARARVVKKKADHYHAQFAANRKSGTARRIGSMIGGGWMMGPDKSAPVLPGASTSSPPRSSSSGSAAASAAAAASSSQPTVQAQTSASTMELQTFDEVSDDDL